MLALVGPVREVVTVQLGVLETPGEAVLNVTLDGVVTLLGDTFGTTFAGGVLMPVSGLVAFVGVERAASLVTNVFRLVGERDVVAEDRD